MWQDIIEPNHEASYINAAVEALKDPRSSTERLRLVTAFFDTSSRLSRSRLISKAASEYITYLGLAPGVALKDYADWRALCGEIDEEVLVAAAIAQALIGEQEHWKEAKKSLTCHPDRTVKLISSWPLFLLPYDKDFCELQKKGFADCHIHFGEMVPAALIWRQLLSGGYYPDAGSSLHERIGSVERVRAISSDLEECFLGTDAIQETRIPSSLSAPLTEIGSSKNIIAYLLKERLLLVYGFIRQLTQAGDAAEANLFWSHVASKVEFSDFLTPQGSGFEEFAMTERHRGSFSLKLAPLVVSHLCESSITSLDVRIVVGTGSRETFKTRTRKMLSSLHEALRAIARDNRPEIRVVLSFSKGRATGSKRRFGVRPANWRRERKLIQAGVLKILQGHFDRQLMEAGFSFSTLGIDMVSSEYGFDVGIAAPAYKMTHAGVRPMTIEAEYDTVAETRILRRLIRCYHTGEDTDHSITAARVSWEAMNWLGLSALDRLGHMTFLVSEAIGYETWESTGERLDNLLWLYNIADRLEAPTRRSVALRARKEAEDLVTELYASTCFEPSIEQLISAWRLRPLEELSSLIPSETPIGLAYLAYAGLEGLASELQPDPLHRSGIESVRKGLSEMRIGKYAEEFVLASRKVVLEEIAARGVRIETCPTSNLVIGFELPDLVPGAKFATSTVYENLLVGSDDPSMFRTDICVESALLMSSMLRTGFPRLSARTRLERIMSTSRRSW